MPEGVEAAVTGPVVLVGLMGSGKTTVGKKLAKLVGVRFVDADVELEARSGRTVAAWFADGEDSFRDGEADLLADLLAGTEPLVVASGGGVVVRPGNRRRLVDRSVTVVYLHAPAAFLATRARAKPHRPLLAGDPAEVLTTMYAERDVWYREVADTVVEVAQAHDAGDRPKWRLATQVVDALDDLGVLDRAAADRLSGSVAAEAGS